MMVHMLSFNSGSDASRMLRFVSRARIPESSSFAFEFLPRLGGIVVLELLVLHRRHLVPVLLWKDFLVLDRLDGGMVVVLVDLAVYGFLDCDMVSD
jgi:hypothetical protein